MGWQKLNCGGPGSLDQYLLLVAHLNIFVGGLFKLARRN